MKIYYNPSEDIILIYLGKSSMIGFSRYMIGDNHFQNCSKTSEYNKSLIYIGKL